jgi:hypothetical protein
MANPVRGTCVCPLCTDHGAEIREGTKGRLYIVCDGCVSMISTMSRQGRALIENRLGAQAAPAPAHKVGAGDTATAAAPAPTPKPAPAPTPKKAMVPSFFGLQPS